MEGEVIAVHDAYSAAVASGVVQCVSLYEAVTAANEIIDLTVETGSDIPNDNIKPDHRDWQRPHQQHH